MERETGASGQESVPSREEWIGRIRSARSLEEVSRLGTEGLGPLRGEWGDDFAQVRALRQFWAQCSFRVGEPRWETAALESAKALAEELMAPAPSRSPEGAFDMRWLEERMGAARRQAAQPFEALGLGEPEAGRAALGDSGWGLSSEPVAVALLSRQWGDWAALEGDAVRFLADPEAGRPKGVVFPSDVRHHQVREAIRAAEGEAASPEEIGEMARRFGFGEIRIGAGAAGRALRQAKQIGRACERLASKANLPDRAIGLGGIGLNIGINLGDSEARFSYPRKPDPSRRNWIEFGDPAGSLGHEWTHALEFHAATADPGASGARLASGALAEAWRDAPQDPGAAATLREEMRQALRGAKALLDQKAAIALALRGRPEKAASLGVRRIEAADPKEDPEWGRYEKESPPEALARETDRLLAGAERGSFAKMAAFARLWLWSRSALDPGAAGHAAALLDTAKGYLRIRSGSRAIERRLEEGASAFAAATEWAGVLGGEGFGRYYESALERAARVGEGFFHDPEIPALAFAHPRDASRPQGVERAHANEAFGRLLGAYRERFLEREAQESARLEGEGAPGLRSRLRELRKARAAPGIEAPPAPRAGPA